MRPRVQHGLARVAGGLGALALTVLAGCDAPAAGRGARPAGTTECLSGKCDQAGPSTDDPTQSSSEAEALLDELRECYISNNALETGRPECLDEVMESVETLLDEYNTELNAAEFQNVLCSIVNKTTSAGHRNRRTEACEVRAEVVLAETILSIVPLGTDPLNTIPSKRARQQFGDCMDESADADARDLLECARDQTEARLGDVRHNLRLGVLEGDKVTEDEATAWVDAQLHDLVVEERGRQARRCADLAEDHEDEELTTNLCQLESEAQVAFELGLTEPWSAEMP